MKRRREEGETRRSVRRKDGLYNEKRKEKERERGGKGILRRWEEVILYLP